MCVPGVLVVPVMVLLGAYRRVMVLFSTSAAAPCVCTAAVPRYKTRLPLAVVRHC